MRPARPRAARPVRVTGVEPGALRAGYYSDSYFLQAACILRLSAGAGERFAGRPLALRGPADGIARHVPGNAVVEMQYFARRAPRFLAAGIGPALGILRDGLPAPRRGPSATWSRPAARALPEGSLARPRQPVLVVRGRYRDFAHLETPMLGVLARCSRVATNVYEALVAARGKPILFFPARFDLPQCQPLDGYAYGVALQAYARSTGRVVPAHVSTDAQGMLWGQRGGGTMPHAFVLCFLGDTAEATLALCRHMPTRILRVALVDTTNDCAGEAVRTARGLFAERLRLLRAGRRAEAARHVLHAVRIDTAQDLKDRRVPSSSDPRRERGVTPVLARIVRRALDDAPAGLGLAGRWRREAERYFRGVRIVATGGFTREKIRYFESERAPVDVYGIGSALLRGDANEYTADVVRVRVGGRFVVACKTGRRPGDFRGLLPARLG